MTATDWTRLWVVPVESIVTAPFVTTIAPSVTDIVPWFVTVGVIVGVFIVPAGVNGWSWLPYNASF